MESDRSKATSWTVAFVQPIGIGLLIGSAFLVIFLLALHDPTPRDLPVAVVAPSGVVGTLGSNEALDPRPVDDADEARQQVEDGDVVAAYLADGPDHRLLVAGARGVIVTQTVTGVFTPIAARAGAELQVQDVVPIAPEDPRGLSSFYLIFGITLGAFIFGQSSHTFGRHLSVTRKLVQTLLFAVTLGIVGAAVANGWLQVLPGSALAVTGILVLLAAAVGAFTVALTTLLADAGVALSTLVAVILGTAVSGGAVPASFIPEGFRVLSPVLPPGAAFEAVSDVAYFDAAAATGPLLVLTGWLVGSVLVIVAATALRRRLGPAARPEPVRTTAQPEGRSSPPAGQPEGDRDG